MESGTFNQLFKGFVNEVISPFFPKTLEQLAEGCEKKIDRIILKEEVENDYDFAGGEFTISYYNKNSFLLSASLYFKDTNEDWVEVKSESQPRDMNILRAKRPKNSAPREKPYSISMRPSSMRTEASMFQNDGMLFKRMSGAEAEKSCQSFLILS